MRRFHLADDFTVTFKMMFLQNFEYRIDLPLFYLNNSPKLLVEKDCQGISVSKVYFNTATAGERHFGKCDKQPSVGAIVI